MRGSESGFRHIFLNSLQSLGKQRLNGLLVPAFKGKGWGCLVPLINDCLSLPAKMGVDTETSGLPSPPSSQSTSCEEHGEDQSQLGQEGKELEPCQATELDIRIARLKWPWRNAPNSSWYFGLTVKVWVGKIKARLGQNTLASLEVWAELFFSLCLLHSAIRLFAPRSCGLRRKRLPRESFCPLKTGASAGRTMDLAQISRGQQKSATPNSIF